MFVEEIVAATVSTTARNTIPVATSDAPLITEQGDVLEQVDVAYETWGELNVRRDNVVLIVHALTGDSHAAPHGPSDHPGWWDQLIGPGRAIDTDRTFVICSNVLGSCYGTTGPRSINPATGAPYNLQFPNFTIRDIVGVQARLLDALAIPSLRAVIGGSIGGMQALEWAVMYPDRVEKAIPIATSGQFTAQGIAFNEVQRRVIMLDPAWQQGEYDDSAGPAQGLAVARMLGMITYQSDEVMTARFGRREDAQYTAWPSFFQRYDVEGYLHYQGDKLVNRFDANTYLYLTRAMDSHDLARGRGSYEDALRRIQAETLMIGIRSDLLFPTYQVRDVADRLTQLGKPAAYREIDSPNGHDSFLKDFDLVAPLIEEFLEPGT